MILSEKIKNIIAEQGLSFKEKGRTIYTTCPVCGREDKFSILKENGACICYRSSCDFGKKWFIDWIVLTANISYKEAKGMLSDVEIRQFENENGELKIDLDAHEDASNNPASSIKPIRFPEFHMVSIEKDEAIEGRSYLASRGIPQEIAKKYEIHYSPLFRRVYFPIKVNGQFLGFQGRHIDNVHPSEKVRNNEGFSRESLVMFIDNIKDKNYVIVAEGPVDAIKFDQIGGNVCTMGKIVTEKQQKLIFNKNVKKVYLALDEDADIETRNLQWKYGDREIYLAKIPESAKIRCEAEGKKADFGECTFEECVLAIKNAIKMDGSELLIHLK